MAHFVHSYNSKLLQIVTTSSAQDWYRVLFSFSVCWGVEEPFVCHQQVLTWECWLSTGTFNLLPPCLPCIQGVHLPQQVLGEGTRQAVEGWGFGFWAGKEAGQIILLATPSSIQAFPRRSLNAEHHLTLCGSKIMIITAKNIKLINNGSVARVLPSLFWGWWWSEGDAGCWEGVEV